MSSDFKSTVKREKSYEASLRRWVPRGAHKVPKNGDSPAGDESGKNKREKSVSFLVLLVASKLENFLRVTIKLYFLKKVKV